MLYQDVECFCRAFRLAQFFSVIIIFSLFVPVATQAQEPEVVAGQYVITRSVFAPLASHSALSPDAAEMVASTLESNEGNRSTVSLVSPNTLAASSSESVVEGEIVPYNASAHQAFCKALKSADSTVEGCDPNYVLKADITPNDTNFSSLWGMNKIQAEAAWNVSTGSSSVVVAVVDTGVDYTHPDLSQNIWTNSGEIAGNGKDDDGNGYIDDVHGMNAINGSGDPMDDNSHGTHCSGTIGAAGNNGLGVAGVNWNVSIMGAKFLSSNGAGSLYGAVKAINYAVANGAKIISASWGGGGYSQALYDAIKSARDAGVLFVAAAGNSGLNTDLFPSYPSSYDLDNVISVGALAKNDVLASFSNYGESSVDIAAPGVAILSTVPGGSYDSYSGTSMATPHVAGVAALVKSNNSNLSYLELKARIFDANTIAGLAGKVAGARSLNAYRALTSNASNPGSGGDEPKGDGVSIVNLTGHNGSPYLTIGKAFNLVIGGPAGQNASINLSFRGAKGSLGQCALGNAQIGSIGSVNVSGVIRLKGAAAREATSVKFTAGSDSKRRTLRGTRSSKGEISRRKARRTVAQSCELISASMSSY